MKSCKGVLKDSFVRLFVIGGKRFMELIKYENIEDFVNENMDLILEKEWLN